MTGITPVTRQASALLAPNPGPMTLDGTNSYVLRGKGSGACVVVDPGPADDGHLRTLADQGVALILITHGHIDHTEGAGRLHELTGAPVAAASAEHCHGGAGVLQDGNRFEIAGVVIDVVATPGHSADSVSFHLPGDAPLGAAVDAAADASPGCGSVLTGDTVLGRGSTVIGVPDGTLADYLDSLRTLAAVGDGGAVTGLPAHGPVIADLAERCRDYLAHRLRRLDEVRSALDALGTTAGEARGDEGIAAVMRLVYPHVDPAVAMAAAYSVDTQLAYLAGQ